MKRSKWLKRALWLPPGRPLPSRAQSVQHYLDHSAAAALLRAAAKYGDACAAFDLPEEK
jgi:hypothetical protein